MKRLSTVDAEKPDIVLLDVMMPGMDGFEVCRRLKGNPATRAYSGVMVTALDQVSDRVQGLEAGADDFLTKPVNDVALFARVRSLVRLKTMVDELRLRQATGRKPGDRRGERQILLGAPGRGRILIVEDREQSAQRMIETLGRDHDVEIVPQTVEAIVRAKGGDYDLVIASLSLDRQDGLRFCAALRSLDATRQTPILTIVDEGDLKRLVRALDIGVNDYLMRPVDRSELLARVRTQLRRKRYADQLRHSLQLSLEMAITDQLTGLFNRRYMSRHLSTLDRQCERDRQAGFVPHSRHRLLQARSTTPTATTSATTCCANSRPASRPTCAVSTWRAGMAARNSSSSCRIRI